MSSTTTNFVCEDDFDCYPNGTCGPELNCRCNVGFWGVQCQETCPIACQNGGQCVVKDEHGGLINENDVSCACPAGYSGGLCETSSQAVVGGGKVGGTGNGNQSSNSLSAGGAIGIALAVAIVCGLVGVVTMRVYRRRRRRHHRTEPKSVQGGDATADPPDEELPPIE